MADAKRFVGIDVAKAQLDVAIGPNGESFSVANDETGISELLRRLEPADLVIIEATGGLEVPVASALATAGIAVAVVNPRQVRDFARATGQLAKTDALDAQVLARFGEAVKPQVRALRDAQAQALEALVNRRRQLVEMLTAEKNRRANSPKVIHKGIDEHIRWLEKRLSGLDDELAGLVRETPIWRERDELLRSVPGVGKVLSTTLLAHLPELGHLIANKSPRWSDWRPLTATAVACAAAVVSGVVAPRSGASCIWPWSPRFVPIQSSRTFTPSCVRAGNTLNRPSLPACASCS